MKSNNLFLLALTFFATIATGCGRNYAGNYNGTIIETTNMQAGMQSPTQTGSLMIYQNSGTMVTGTVTANGQTGTFQGTANGDSLTAVTVNLQPTGSAYSMCNSFMGTLMFTQSNQLTGTLSPMASTQGTSMGYGGTCTGTMTFNLQKTN